MNKNLILAARSDDVPAGGDCAKPDFQRLAHPSDTGPPDPLDLELITAGDILNALPVGAYITDTKRKIFFWNDAAERITGWQRDSVVGKHCHDNILVHVDKDGHCLCGCEHCPLHRSMVTGEKSPSPSLIFARSRSGTRIPVEVTVAPLRNHGGTVIGGIEVFRDMTPMMDELNRARHIQQHSLVSVLPEDARLHFATRYTPHDMVGGDFFRIEMIAPDQYAVLVADVMGHGVAAALYTMQIRSVWEDYRRQLGSPRDFMGALNRRLHSLTGHDDYFATGVFAHINAANGLVEYVRAGHEAPLIVSASGEVKQLDRRDAGLGIFPGCVYHPGNARLEPGDSLLIYTDGAVEITDAKGEELGVEGFARMLEGRSLRCSDQALADLEVRLLEYSNDIRLPDDLTMVCVQRAPLASASPAPVV